MQPTRRVVLELLRQFRLKQIIFSEKNVKMAEETESTQQITDNDIFHDIDICQEICLMMRVTQNNRPYPFSALQKGRLWKNINNLPV